MTVEKKKRPPVLDWTGGVWIISPKKIHVIFIDVGGGERGEAWGGGKVELCRRAE